MSGAAPLVIQNLIDLKQFADAEQTLRRMDPTAGLEDDGSWERARQKVLIAQIDLGLGRTKKVWRLFAASSPRPERADGRRWNSMPAWPSARGNR